MRATEVAADLVPCALLGASQREGQDFDLSHDSQLLASYEAGAIAYLVIVNPQFGIEQSQHLTLRYTLRKNGIPYWTEQELLWKGE